MIRARIQFWYLKRLFDNFIKLTNIFEVFFIYFPLLGKFHLKNPKASYLNINILNEKN